MTSVKKFNGNLIVQTPYATGVNSNITLDTDNVIVTGNLNVLGNTFVIESNNLTITDNVIVLNKGEPGAGVHNGTGNASIVVDRGTLPNVAIGYYESTNTWRITNDGANYYNIATSSTGGTVVHDDANPVLGGNLNVQGKTIYANVVANTYVTIQGVMSIINANITPLTNAGTTVFYANTAGAGTAGLYVVNEQATNEELVTKRRAFGFSLIL